MYVYVGNLNGRPYKKIVRSFFVAFPNQSGFRDKRLQSFHTIRLNTRSAREIGAKSPSLGIRNALLAGYVKTLKTAMVRKILQNGKAYHSGMFVSNSKLCVQYAKIGF